MPLTGLEKTLHLHENRQKILTLSILWQHMKYFIFALLTLPSILLSDERPSNGTHRVFQFENEFVKVWKTVILPHEPLKFHRHDHPRVVVALKGGTLKKIEESGEISDLLFETGKAYWLSEDPENTFHGDINQSNEPIEVMVIEMRHS